MSRIDKMVLSQLAAVKASAEALGGQCAALMETLALLNANLAESEKPKGPRCPKCGSPKYHNLGREEDDTGSAGPIWDIFQCFDCYTKYPGVPIERADT